MSDTWTRFYQRIRKARAIVLTIVRWLTQANFKCASIRRWMTIANAANEITWRRNDKWRFASVFVALISANWTKSEYAHKSYIDFIFLMQSKSRLCACKEDYINGNTWNGICNYNCDIFVFISILDREIKFKA